MVKAVVALGVAWVGSNCALLALLVRRARRLGRLGRVSEPDGSAGQEQEVATSGDEVRHPLV